MTIKYDKISDAVYMAVNKGKVAKTVPMNDTFNVDYDASGAILGFEILDASSQQELLKSIEGNVENGIPVEIVSGTPVFA